MKNITYLFGAGASAECLPVVSQMAKRVIDIKNIFANNFNDQNRRVKYNDRLSPLAQELITELDQLAIICQKHSSVDTYAKMLHIKRSDDYKNLKNILTIFFMLAQKFSPEAGIKLHNDRRYDNFWATILNSRTPGNNLRILSWNYDTQFEISYANLFGDSLRTAYSLLNIHGPNDNDILNYKKDDFAIFKLNGSARVLNYDDDNGPLSLLSFSDITLRDFIEEILLRYEKMKKQLLSPNGCRSDISFAWDGNKDDYFTKIRDSISQTEILVIIGYSFPVFNRRIDKMLFDMMPTTKMYLQAQEEDLSDITERLKIIRNIPTIRIKGTSQFVFPPELDISG